MLLASMYLVHLEVLAELAMAGVILVVDPWELVDH